VLLDRFDWRPLDLAGRKLEKIMDLGLKRKVALITGGSKDSGEQSLKNSRRKAQTCQFALGAGRT
jgi:hypothetical protein